MEKTQKEYYLNEQMQAIQKELAAIATSSRTSSTSWKSAPSRRTSAKEARRRVKELKKLRMMAPMSAEAAVVRNYLDWVLALPWGEAPRTSSTSSRPSASSTRTTTASRRSRSASSSTSAVQALVQEAQGADPLPRRTARAWARPRWPRSIATATGRKFVRLSLGGVRDEAEIRGHRRTYIGALPGKIIQSLKKAGQHQNPVFLLDEVDKMSTDFRGDPAAALLEVLDPEQNNTFNDHYLDLDYDLSDVMFITTANYLQGIPMPLQDRMEIIQLPGYTEFEKVSIAERYLIPKQKRDNGIADVAVDFPEDTVRDVIHYYTKEAGVRNLEREIATVCRKIARDVVAKKSPVQIADDGVRRRAGGSRPSACRVTWARTATATGARRASDEIGLVNGLAVTMHGGDLLATEVSIVAGKGKLVLTGKLGDVMQESAQAAISYVRARAPSLGLDRDFYSRADIHVHLPEGAIPKDGPSAGITMCTGMVSALLRVPGPPRRRDDRRDHAARPRAAHRRPQGEDPRRAPRGHHDGDHAQGERQGPARHPQARAQDACAWCPSSTWTRCCATRSRSPIPRDFLKEPSVPVDWRVPAERRDSPRDRREDSSRYPVASAVPPPSAREDPPASEPPASTPESPGSDPGSHPSTARPALDLDLQEIAPPTPRRR